MFSLLDVVGEAGAEWAAVAFRRYAEAFEGRRQLVWSGSVRKALDLGEFVPDEDVAIDEPAEIVVVAIINPFWWSAVKRWGDREFVLQVAEAGGQAAVMSYVGGLIASHRREWDSWAMHAKSVYAYGAA
jgi:NAD(P)H-dependent flavin oxidoreductase YrpB (nitropropane dioxygenase family)